MSRRVKGKTGRIQSNQIGSALVYVRRNAQHRELKLSTSTRFVLITGVMVAVSPNGPTGCLVSPLPLSSQNVQPHETFPTSHSTRGETQAMSLALGENREGKERVKRKASRIQSSREGAVLVCVRQNAQYLELKLPGSTQFVLVTDVMVAMSTCGPTGCLVSPLPLSPQNVQSHETFPTSHSARGETKAMTLALGANLEGKESKGLS